MSAWQKVDRATAESHRLFGLRGWLRLPSLPLALVLPGVVLSLALGLALPLAQGLPPLIGLADGLDAALLLAVSVLWFRRWRHFRPAYLAFSLATSVQEGFDLVREAPLAADPGGEVALFVIFLALDIAFLLAMQRSRRFRVTFEHRVRADLPGEVALTPPAAAHSPGLPPAPSC
ncbi:hypothetical protein [Falsiroseomonas selenitidurans]|uniref:Uncharacterized protein n=1 Tax=Falsiroseomonas selenitidurans TaxID=2716335 RepID=A0ABX1E1F9_9PROT|nr:hypothetical protein [Falsiroseomonas selenitidurans]NKC29362.1 hypothetical protein [Falsiroseomonas selenitidurans]